MKRITVIILFTLFLKGFIFASTGGEVEYTCPLCDNVFNYWVQFSYTTFGQNLDFRPWGAAVIPTPIPKCNKCSFVFDNKLFNKIEIDIFKDEFKYNNIFEKEPNMPNYYYLAREYEILLKELKTIIWFLLNAVWENKNENNRLFLINTTIEYINKLLPKDKDYDNHQLIKLDLLRRSGQFKEANDLILKIKQNKNFYKDYVVNIIDLQIELIKNENQEEHRMPDR